MNLGFPFPGAPRNSLPNPPTDKFSKLQYLLPKCNYRQQNTYAVREAASKVLRQFPDLACDTLSWNQKGIVKTFLEIKGTVNVNYKESQYSIKINIMLPENFPQERPYMRIINPDPNSHYKNYQSKHDPTSYLLSNLTTIQCWGVYSSITGLIQEAQLLMGTHFPFKKKPNNNQVQNQLGFNSNQYFSKSDPPQRMSQPKLTPVFGSGYGDPTHNIPKKLTPEQQNAKKSLDIYISKSRILAQESYRVADQLLIQRVKDFMGIQNLDTLSEILDSQNVHLKSGINGMIDFTQKNDKGDMCLKNVVIPFDDHSAALLQVVCSHKASCQSLFYVENLFSNSEIQLDQFLKLVRRIQQQRFMSQYLINRLLKYNNQTK